MAYRPSRSSSARTRATWRCKCWNPSTASADGCHCTAQRSPNPLPASRGQTMADDNEHTSPEEQALADEWAAALSESGDSANQDDIDAMLAVGGAAAPAAPRAPMEEFGSGPRGNLPVSLEGPNLDVILDLTIRNLLQLNQGSVIELDRLAGEPLDVLVNGTLIAHGEVVVVNEKFGIRLTDVISPSERIKKLR